MLDDELLKKARDAGMALADRERQALLARAEYHTAVRRLHLAGGSLREIAQALAISHQRVQQIVDEAGGSWWQRVWKTRNVTRDAVCTFCGHPPSEVAKLIAGPNVFICDRCVGKAERDLRVAATKGRCAFCGKRRDVATRAEGSACAECLRLCREILEQRSSG